MSGVRAAKKAVRELLSLGDHFSFATEKDKSAWLALLLTVAFRKKIRGPVPMFWIVGDPRTGKTTLARYTAQLGALASGRTMPDVRFSHSLGVKGVMEAVKKRIPMAIIDPVQRPLSGDGALCSIVWDTAFTERIVGREGKRFENETVFCAVGTRLFASKALKRRTVPIVLVSGPDYDPACNEVLKGDEIELQEQAKILFQNAANVDSRAVGSVSSLSRISWTLFKKWSQLIRLPLIAAGMPDPVPSFFEDEESDAATKV